MHSYTLSGVILRSMLRTKRQYIGYLAAIVLAVATFFSFGFFLFHPTLQSQLSGDVSSALSQLLVVGQVGVGLFAIFFVLFFHRFLLRLRGQEFGLLLALGISSRLLQRMVRLESVVLAAVALALGLLLGFAEAFGLFHLIASPLGVPALSADFSVTAIFYGLGFFVVLFGIDTYASTRKLHRLTPKVLFTAAETTQGMTQVSRIKLTFGILSLVVGYILAIGFQGGGAGVGSVNMLPIVVLVSIGTYLLFSEGLAVILSWRRRKTTSGVTLLIASRLRHRARDFARILTVVTLLHTGVITLTSVALAIFSHLHQMATTPAELKLYLQLFSIVLFVFFFLAFLFFIAALSTLSVKLFTQTDEDRKQFFSLKRIGLSPREVHTVVSRELAILFFAPATLAVVHSIVAMVEFTTKIAPENVSNREPWLYFSVICGIYLLVMIVYFSIIRRSYIQALTAR